MVVRRRGTPEGGTLSLALLLQDLDFGGTQRQTVELAHRLDRERFAPELWVLKKGEDLAPIAREYGIPVVRLGDASYVSPGSLHRLYSTLRQRPPHCLTTLTAVPNIWGRLLGRLVGAPLILGSCRGGGAPKRQHEKWLWRFADHHMTNTVQLKRRLIAECGVPEAHISVIHNGVDVSYFSPPPEGERERVEAEDGPVVLCVARLVEDKDHASLLTGYARIAADHPDAQLWLVGDGPLEANLRKRVGKLLDAAGASQDRVRFVPGQLDLRDIYARASMLVLPSIREAMPNVVLEAMACGLPVVATQVGGLPEMVAEGETGLLVPARNPEALGDAIGRLLTEVELRRAMGRRGRKRAEYAFSWRAMVERFSTLVESLVYQNALAEGPPGESTWLG
ncbi:glycosyltransferase family 4 protein [Oceanidesulfovibrio marinus]|uniref:Glycosyl transferase n=1 Tax=Oceanidesulfovibrio marinus TaxID=370038 RepID=A0A6P1ZIZ0_9BACT|nr:glycosyltransferase family 4 protein [Oceanidesulfovibrio marinus]TVM33110.1 glycosyl transferase [Oceanidesulfovibrio marinus]